MVDLEAYLKNMKPTSKEPWLNDTVKMMIRLDFYRHEPRIHTPLLDQFDKYLHEQTIKNKGLTHEEVFYGIARWREGYERRRWKH